MTDTGVSVSTGLENVADLEATLESLLSVERFDPSAAFTRRLPMDADRAAAEADPNAFWARKAEELLTWHTPFTQVLDDSNPPFYTWFADGMLNLSENCLDRHVAAGRGERVAFHWHGEEGERRTVTYADLLADTQRLANGLRSLGVRAGDVVGIFLPMIPEVAVAMLACARIGAVHNVVFGGFAPSAVRERMEVSDAKVLITVDGARRKGRTAPVKAAVDAELGDLPALGHIVVVSGPGGTGAPMTAGRDVWYHELLATAAPDCPPEPLSAEHPLFILYSSGSTAKPKGILHTTAGYLLGATYTHRAVFDIDPDTDVYWCSADVGWITGHSYIVYGPLSNGVTSVMYEGAPDYPDYDIWWRLIEEYKVTVFYTAPTAIRTCIKWGARYPGRHDLSSLRVLGTVGEPINPKAWLWYHVVIGGGRCPIVDTWWQTETGSALISPLAGVTSTKPGSATLPLPGISPALLSEDGEPVTEGTGILVITKPWPSMLRTLYKDDERFVKTYFSRFGPSTYVVGDAARLDADGYFWIIGRIDDVINVSGHRLSTAEVESAIVAHEAVAEAAVVAQYDEQTGQAIVAFVTLAGDRSGDEATEAELREHVARRIGKLARPRRIIWADDLPKTRSGKIMRRLLRDIAEGRELGDVTTLRDPAVMAALTAKVGTARDNE
ncbi:acetyl-coenzyme A synthetase [Frankia casuarinae]|uniref:Acetate--CoA ligase n=2 Tax=Frankia casuarinae (strain DSM 45818 / CECT 9043 / HFP020203 / CcI3) TaxID=106370 RepID=Q2J6S7_FRACC|nr:MULTISPECIES: acetate--CoA ligase [Frankia]ABD13015.1 acetyl-coenzyme A synthetase [Frankia casuarinae]ETA01806.1 acetyl-coenzyme A synthetase [Frankia sp. CcI6]EYT92477.1 acetyl-coenzyme A synthetase [Frankia casuarinae]KDA41294.1 acetyl-coenzyme A synthetase [Frankia sp. BMG5.23]OHV53566.1 acetate--CoA ligase [Frankia sp. CgIS1]